MSAFPLNPADYDCARQPLTLCGKAAALEQFTPRRSTEQTQSARQAANDALYAAFRADTAAPETPKGGIA